MGYPPGVKGYRVCDKVTGQFFNCRDVIFNENLGLPHLFGDALVLAPDLCSDSDEDNSDDGGGGPPAESSVVPPPTSPVSSGSAPSPGLPALHHSDHVRTLTEAGHAFQDSIKHAKACLVHRSTPSPLVLDTVLPPSSSLSLLSPLTPLPDSSPDSGDSDSLLFSEAVVNLVLIKHANLAICSNTHRDPGAPGYDLSVPPATYDEAMRCPDANRWRAVMEKEMGLLRDMQVYDLVSLPPGVETVLSLGV